MKTPCHLIILFSIAILAGCQQTMWFKKHIQVTQIENGAHIKTPFLSRKCVPSVWFNGKEMPTDGFIYDVFPRYPVPIEHFWVRLKWWRAKNQTIHVLVSWRSGMDVYPLPADMKEFDLKIQPEGKPAVFTPIKIPNQELPGEPR